MRRSLVALSVVSLGLMPRGAAAGDEDLVLPKAQGTRIGIDADWWPARDQNSLILHSFTFDLVAQIQITRTGYFDIDMPWGIWAWNEKVLLDVGRSSMTIAGNPTIGAHWANRMTGRIALFAGGTFTVSTLLRDAPSLGSGWRTVPGNPYDTFWLAVARAHASTNRAYADLHRFLPDYLFLRGRGGIEARILPVLYYRGDFTPIIAAPIGDWPNDTEIFVEVNQEIEGRASFGGGGGLRLQAVFMPTDFGTIDLWYTGQVYVGTANTYPQQPLLNSKIFLYDGLQTAIEPYLVWERNDGLYARAGLLLALDDELGFGFDDGKLATFRITLGGKW